MKILIQKCDFCQAEDRQELGQGYQDAKVVFRLANKEACLACHEKAKNLLLGESK